MPRNLVLLALAAAVAACGDDSAPSDADGADTREATDDAALEAEAATDDAAPDGPDVGDDAPADAAPDAPDAAPATLHDELLLHAAGGSLVRPDGTPVDFRGAISCCGGAYGWPLFDEAWADYAAAKAVTFLHVRLGPFLTGPGGESDWAAVGGGYPEGPDGRADLATWNEPFWARVRALLEYAAQRGMWVEVDLVDGWAAKHCRWGDTPGYSPWDAAWNVQGEDWCTTAGSREISGDDVHERWVRKAVRETGRWGNVLYQDGNEIGIVGGYAPEWTLSLRNIVRDEEARNGWRRHPFGTNSDDPAAMAADGVDYLEFHQDGAADPAGCFGRPCGVNEYNPDPALTPEQLHAAFCAARAWGTYYWYWRHGQDAAAMDRSLDLLAAGCG
ncbi:MAG: hypothetical protein JXB32_08155 [Deltaproteobacteria bacterium]|nr:hypothetical protein [Deltaproteobacteria bacterium]